MAILFFLGLFQLSEYYVCGGVGVSAATWSRVGYVAITMLPPLGLHLAHVIAKNKKRILVWFAYASGITWALVFGLSEWAFGGHVCAGNYVIFQLRNNVGGAYFAYYYFWLFMVLILCSYWYTKTTNKRQKEALHYLVLGYLVFILPTTIVNTLKPSTMLGLPSIMCGFAVIYAVILTFLILPRINNSKSISPKQP
ncbi:MAG: hypothetical protein ABI354_01225 [Candidatus Saccharimonadales bacterium]